MLGGSSKGISPGQLKASMARLGFVLNDTQLHDLFTRLDSDGSGVLTFADFVTGVLSDEYSVSDDGAALCSIPRVSCAIPVARAKRGTSHATNSLPRHGVRRQKKTEGFEAYLDPWM